MPTNQASAPSKKPTMAKTEIVSIKNHLLASWKMTKGSLKNLVLLWLVMLGVSVGLGIVVFTLGFSTIMASGGLAIFSQPEKLFSLVFSPTGSMLGLVFIIAGIAYTIVSTGINVASIIALHSYREKPQFKDLLNQALQLAWPVYLLGLVIGLITLGGFVLFIIPGIIMAIFLSFAAFEKIFYQASLMNSLRGSYTLIKNNFGYIFIRFLVVIGFYFVFYAFIPEFFGAISESLRNLYDMLSGLAQILINWVAMAFFLLLYNQVRQKTNMKNLANITWMWGIAGVGWFLIIVASVAFYSQLPKLMSLIRSNPYQYTQPQEGDANPIIFDENDGQINPEFNFETDFDTEGLSAEQQQAIEEAEQAMDDYFQQLNESAESVE